MFVEVAFCFGEVTPLSIKVFEVTLNTLPKRAFILRGLLEKTKGLSEQVGKPFASQLTLTVNYLYHGYSLLVTGYWCVTSYTNNQ